MKRLRYIGKTLKQDVTDQKTCSKLVTKQGVTKCNNETSSFFFFKTHFCFVTNETIKIYRKNSETGCNSPKELFKARYETGCNEM